MNILKFNEISFAALLLSLMALVMLPGCSSTEEAPPPTGGGSSCEDLCYSDDVPDMQLDECLMACQL